MQLLEGTPPETLLEFSKQLKDRAAWLADQEVKEMQRAQVIAAAMRPPFRRYTRS